MVESKKNNNFFERLYRHELYVCLISIGHRFKKCRGKDKKWFFWTPIRHVSYNCHSSVGHRHVSDTATNLIIEVFMLHRVPQLQGQHWNFINREIDNFFKKNVQLKYTKRYDLIKKSNLLWREELNQA